MNATVADGADDFLDKWRARWPEWALAEVFVPAARRETVLAWLALRQELLDAAWGGDDPRPGAAKLGWWQEELQAWQQGMRRHPLGKLLQPRAAPWGVLSSAVPMLAATREQRAPERLRPFAEALAGVGAALEPGSHAAPWEGVAAGLRVQRLLGSHVDAAHRDAAAALLAAWPATTGAAGRPLAERLFEAILRGRLLRHARGASGPPPRIAILLSAWRAARGT